MTIEDIFLAAVEKAPAERAAFLDAACAGDAGLRAQVEALLRSHEQGGSLLEQLDPVKARLVTLRYFAGMTIEQAATALNISRVTAHRYWTFARAWLHQQISGAPPA